MLSLLGAFLRLHTADYRAEAKQQTGFQLRISVYVWNFCSQVMRSSGIYFSVLLHFMTKMITFECVHACVYR